MHLFGFIIKKFVTMHGHMNVIYIYIYIYVYIYIYHWMFMSCSKAAEVMDMAM